MPDARGVGEHVDELLDALRAGKGDAAAVADELVRLLVGLYDDGLTRIVAVLAEQGQAGAAIMTALTDDPLVESLLLLHDLHPLDVDTRVQRALDQVRPYLGSHAGGVEYLGVADGVARLRLEGSCHGCPSSAITVRLAIESAVMNAAPEVNEVVVAGMTKPPEPALLQIGRRPEPEDGWITLPNIGPPSSRPVIVSVAGTTVLVCAVRGTLYAYRDACAACGSSLADGALDRERLTCPRCGTRFNVRLAGQGIDDTAARLDPLPLLADSLGVRVALPELTHPHPRPPETRPPETRKSQNEQSEIGKTRIGQSQIGKTRIGQSHVGQSRIASLASLAPGQPAPAESLLGSASVGPDDSAEKCEMCATEISGEHGHLADLEASSLICACRACYLLFTDTRAGRGRYRAIPDRYLTDPGHPMSLSEWDALEIPVGLAFFLRDSRDGGVTGFYPSPAGVTECRLDLRAWDQFVADHPLLNTAAADVEAVLISRSDTAIEYFVVPIDACYELAGRMRLQWRGFDGGAEARASVATFLDRVRSRARHVGIATAVPDQRV